MGKRSSKLNMATVVFMDPDGPVQVSSLTEPKVLDYCYL